MQWQQLKIKVTQESIEFISDFLFDAGAKAITIIDAHDQPLLEPAPGETPLWDEAWVCGLFAENIDLYSIIAQLDHDYRIDSLQDEDWNNAWIKHFPPMQFGERLWVCSEALAHQVPENSASKPVKIILNPGLAFGTGTHPTTALCLEWLEKNMQPGQKIIDYGCGSGILAIAACKLGAKKAWAIDNDPQAIEATHINAVQNQITPDLLEICSPETFSTGNFLTPENKVDIVIANILANPLKILAPLFANYINPRGNIVLSGILAEQQNFVIDAFKFWFDQFEIESKEEWIRIVAYRKKI